MVLTTAPERAGVAAGVRSINLRTDMRAIADLIDAAFAHELGANGRAALRDLRFLARLGPLLYLLIPAGGELGGFFRGFVWEENGAILGNLTLQQVDALSERWMIANVAVEQQQRGRGIARALMNAGLERIRQSGGRWAMLQVRANNHIAHGLYERMGFEKVLAETELHLFQIPQPPIPAPSWPAGCLLHPWRGGDWPDAQRLLRQTLPETARWWHPQRRSSFNHGGDGPWSRRWGALSQQGYRQRLGLWQEGRLLALLDVDVRPRGEHGLDLLVHPSMQGQVEAALLAHGLDLLRAYPRQKVSALLCDYQPEAIAAAEALGFRSAFTLITMRKRVLVPAPRDLYSPGVLR